MCDVICNEAVPFRPYCAGVATRTRDVSEYMLSEYMLVLALCLVTFLISGGVARIWCEGGRWPTWGTKLHDRLLFVARKMMRNNTLNKVHVAATELPQLLSQNTMCGETTAQSRCQTLCNCKVS